MAIQIPIISEFDGAGVQKAVAEFKQLEGAGKKAQYAIKKAAIPAAAALGGLAVALGDAVKGAIEDEAAQKALAGQLVRTTGATQDQIASVEDWISAQGAAFGVADDELRPALTKLATATKDVTRAQLLAKTGMDIAAATGRSYESVVAALTKAELGQYASLKKLGLPLGDNTRALMDMAAETKKVAKAQAEYDAALAAGDKKAITKSLEKLTEAQARLNAVTVEGADYVTDLEKAFGGAAGEAANTAAGGFKRLQLSLSETKESIGAALLPVIEKALPVLNKFAKWAQDNPNVFVGIAAAIGAVSASIVAANVAITLSNPFTAIAAGIGLLVTGLTIAYKKFEGFRDAINGILNGLIGSINLVIRAINLIKPGKDIPSLPLIGAKDNTPAGGLAVPAMAQGGIVTAPTLALIGEAGPEAVVPLDRMRDMGGASNVTINVHGGDPNAVVDALRRYMLQNGSVPIRTAY